MGVEKITAAEAEKELAKVSVRGKWSDLIAQILKDKQPRRVTELKRGQIAALHRAAREAKLRTKADYKNGSMVIAPEAPAQPK